MAGRDTAAAEGVTSMLRTETNARQTGRTFITALTLAVLTCGAWPFPVRAQGLLCAARDVVGGIDTPDEATAVALAGTVAYVADGEAGLQIIDAADPGAP